MILRDYDKFSMKSDRPVINAEEAIIAIFLFYSLAASYPSYPPCRLISFLLKIYIVARNTNAYFPENNRSQYELQDILSSAERNCQFSGSISKIQRRIQNPVKQLRWSVFRK